MARKSPESPSAMCLCQLCCHWCKSRLSPTLPLQCPLMAFSSFFLPSFCPEIHLLYSLPLMCCTVFINTWRASEAWSWPLKHSLHLLKFLQKVWYFYHDMNLILSLSYTTHKLPVTAWTACSINEIAMFVLATLYYGTLFSKY